MLAANTDLGTWTIDQRFAELVSGILTNFANLRGRSRISNENRGNSCSAAPWGWMPPKCSLSPSFYLAPQALENFEV